MSIEDYPYDVLMEYKRLWEEGNLHEANSNNKKAIECYLKMMKITAPDPVIFNRIAYCHLMLNDVKMAKKRLRQSLEIEPENTEALHNLSLLLIDHDELIEAEELTRRAMTIEPHNSSHWKNLGEIQYKQGHYQQSIQALATSIGLAPDNYDTHHKLALAYIRIADSGNAHREFLRAIELCNDDGELFTDYALLFFVQDRHPEAEPYLRRAVEVDSLRTMPHYMLAHCLLEQVRQAGDEYSEDMVGEIMDLLNKTLELDVLCGEAWYLWGKLMVMFRDWESAEKYLRAGTEHGTAHPECWALLSLTLSELGREEEANRVFDEFKQRERAMNGIE